MAADRSTIRDTFVYASDDRDTQLGGLYTSPSITNDNFYSMVEIICVFSDTFELHNDKGQHVERDDKQLQPGDYYIEVPLSRTTSMLSGTLIESFCEGVRHRDGGCILTGRRGIPGRWASLQAVHIFPLAYEGLWNHYGYGNSITIPPDRESDGSINSVQNGICLSGDMQCFFDDYLVAINPNIVSFGPELLYYNLPTHINPLLRQNIGWPPDKLLLWHFRQAVLANMKGAGEPFFETDFPPGTDMISEIKMEFELFGRLNATVSCG
ncbi:hypothetical protein HOY82DRAFT_577530 [Tuber indicum]|nr:hypothetical protein HOY82DRAFT_577530 [Tuber indicum]